MASDWPLLTGGHYSELVIRTGLTVEYSDYYKASNEFDNISGVAHQPPTQQHIQKCDPILVLSVLFFSKDCIPSVVHYILSFFLQ